MTVSFSRQEYLDAVRSGKDEKRWKEINPNSEDAIQANFFEWVTLHEKQFPQLELFHSIPNGGKRSKIVGWLYKLTGMHPGVPDTNLPVSSYSRKAQKQHHGLWIEFKRPGEKLRPEQVVWINRLREAGHRVEVCYSWVEAANITIEYLDLELERL